MASVDFDDGWAENFLSDVQNGHSARSMHLCNAILNCRALPGGRLDVADMRRILSSQNNPVKRNQIVRDWVMKYRDEIAASWEELGLPCRPVEHYKPPPKRVICGDARRVRGPIGTVGPVEFQTGSPCETGQDAGRGEAQCEGAVVFDFDQTLTTRHVHPFEDVQTAVDRVFGGADRVAMLRTMLEQVRACGMAVAIITRGSRHIAKKFLGAVGLLQYVTWGLVFGNEDYDDSAPKSSVLAKHVLPVLRVPPENVLFIDDDASNIDDVHHRIPGCQFIMPARSGLGEQDCMQIVIWADTILKGASDRR